MGVGVGTGVGFGLGYLFSWHPGRIESAEHLLSPDVRARVEGLSVVAG